MSRRCSSGWRPRVLRIRRRRRRLLVLMMVLVLVVQWVWWPSPMLCGDERTAGNDPINLRHASKFSLLPVGGVSTTPGQSDTPGPQRPHKSRPKRNRRFYTLISSSHRELYAIRTTRPSFPSQIWHVPRKAFPPSLPLSARAPKTPSSSTIDLFDLTDQGTQAIGLVARQRFRNHEQRGRSGWTKSLRARARARVVGCSAACVFHNRVI